MFTANFTTVTCSEALVINVILTSGINTVPSEVIRFLMYTRELILSRYTLRRILLDMKMKSLVNIPIHEVHIPQCMPKDLGPLDRYTVLTDTRLIFKLMEFYTLVHTKKIYKLFCQTHTSYIPL